MSDIIKVAEFTALITSAPEALNKNNVSVSKCNDAGQCLLDTIESTGGMNDDIDTACSEYLKKVSTTIENMKKRRAPITQIFDHIRSVFTSSEKSIDPKDGKTIPGRIAYARDQYAAQKLQEERKRREEALRLSNIENEKVSYKLRLEDSLNQHYQGYFSEQSAGLTHLFTSIRYDNYDVLAKRIRNYAIEYPMEHFSLFTTNIETFYLDPLTKGNIKADVFRGRYERFAQHYKFDMEDLRQSYIDRLPSLYQELKETENLRRVNAEAAARAEQERLEKIIAEQRNKDAEAAARAEQEKIILETAKKKAQITSLFTVSESATTVTSSPVKAKVSEKINVLHPAGFVEIYQMWWLNEGCNLPIDELEKIHKKMITFCEKQAKSENRIKSTYIQYVEDIKAK